MRSHATLLFSFVFAVGGLVVLGPGCGSSGSEFPNENPDGSFPDDGPSLGDVATGDAKPCTGLCQQQVNCPNGGDTTVTGVVYDPAGKVPIYNVAVYVPNAPVDAIKTGASCDRCDPSLYSGNPLTGTLTNAKGEFKIPRVPVGKNIPLVIQVGKWRRQITIPTVKECVNTPLTNKNQTRLPKNRGEGNIPLIAITTGGADSIECLPLRMGIDKSEFSTKDGPGRIHLYKGEDLISGNPNNSRFSRKKFDPEVANGVDFALSTALWSTTNQLKAYDMVILSCEGRVNEDSKPQTARNALYEYETIGGRVFASHWHRYWFSDGPSPVPSIGTWKDNIQGEQEQTAIVQTAANLPKVNAFADWLQNVGATDKRGELKITAARDNLNKVNRSVATEWATIPQYVGRVDGKDTNADPAAAVQFISYNAPIGAADDKICGRAVFTDLHVSAGARDDKAGFTTTFPKDCVDADLSDQEKALEFMLFDLASCVSNDRDPPPPVVN